MSILGRISTLGTLLAHFARRGRWFFLPLVLVLLIGGLLLAVTGGLAYVTPFLYTLF